MTPSSGQSERSGRRICAGAAAISAAISGSASRNWSCEAEAAVSGTILMSQANPCGSGVRCRVFFSVDGCLGGGEPGDYVPNGFEPAHDEKEQGPRQRSRQMSRGQGFAEPEQQGGKP